MWQDDKAGKQIENKYANNLIIAKKEKVANYATRGLPPQAMDKHLTIQVRLYPERMETCSASRNQAFIE